MAVTTALLLIAVTALTAVIAQLKRKRAVAIGLVILLGALLGNMPGVVGDWTGAATDWLYDLPEAISGAID